MTDLRPDFLAVDPEGARLLRAVLSPQRTATAPSWSGRPRPTAESAPRRGHEANLPQPSIELAPRLALLALAV